MHQLLDAITVVWLHSSSHVIASYPSIAIASFTSVADADTFRSRACTSVADKQIYKYAYRKFNTTPLLASH